MLYYHWTDYSMRKCFNFQAPHFSQTLTLETFWFINSQNHFSAYANISDTTPNNHLGQNAVKYQEQQEKDERIASSLSVVSFFFSLSPPTTYLILSSFSRFSLYLVFSFRLSPLGRNSTILLIRKAQSKIGHPYSLIQFFFLARRDKN